MRRSKRTILAILAILVLANIGIRLVLREALTHKDQPIDYWINGLAWDKPDVPYTQEVRAMGAKALPCVIEKLHAPDRKMRLLMTMPGFG